MAQSIYPPNNKYDTLFSRSGKSKIYTTLRQLASSEPETIQKPQENPNYVEEMRQKMGLWHNSGNEGREQTLDSFMEANKTLNPESKLETIFTKESPNKISDLRAGCKDFKYQESAWQVNKKNLTSSFSSEPREAEFQRHLKQLNPSMPGKYNLKFNSTEKRVQGVSFSKIGAKIHKRLNSSTLNSPICGRIIRALNSGQSRGKTMDHNSSHKFSPHVSQGTVEEKGHSSKSQMSHKRREISTKTTARNVLYNKASTTDKLSRQKKEYHLIISNTDRFIDVSGIPEIKAGNKGFIHFDRMSTKQYISPKYAASELKHSNPKFNKLDIKEVNRKVPVYEIKKGKNRDPYYNKLWQKLDPGLKNQADYDISKSFQMNSKKVSSPRFNKMMERSNVNSIYYRTDDVRDDVDNDRLQKGINAVTHKSSGAYINWDKQKKRDSLLYTQTEAFKNIQNENTRYELIQQMLKEL
ncbi:unnamed protein product [Moneuplotes crassus]|uniref:Uncharacterized protein n=1 Tax=Euplotes crassus TaxID=5936 RepID=A0AAD1X7T6_EUPCR|nr:unnamed protein product [Moneuplotes crassus]